MLQLPLTVDAGAVDDGTVEVVEEGIIEEELVDVVGSSEVVGTVDENAIVVGSVVTENKSPVVGTVLVSFEVLGLEVGTVVVVDGVVDDVTVVTLAVVLCLVDLKGSDTVVDSSVMKGIVDVVNVVVEGNVAVVVVDIVEDVVLTEVAVPAEPGELGGALTSVVVTVALAAVVGGPLTDDVTNRKRKYN